MANAYSARPKGKLRKLHQVAALPMREQNGRVEVCLVTTRETRRWTVPKGWPMKGHKDFDAAGIEAREEAGIDGTAGETPVGHFRYWKRRKAHFDCISVDVYPLWAAGSLDVWKEQGERAVRWVSPEDAALVVDDPGLAALLLSLAAGNLPVRTTARASVH